jgi:hypothetical protein
MTKLSGTLPGGDNNGLNGLARALTADPHKTAIIVAVVDCKSITIDTDTGDKVATVRIRRVEPIDPQDTDTAQRLLKRGLERRTGAVMLPIDLEDELTALFANLVDMVDMETGELPAEDAEATDDGEAVETSAPEAEAEVFTIEDLTTPRETTPEEAAALEAMFDAPGFVTQEDVEGLPAEPEPPVKKSLAEELAETDAKAAAEFKPKTARKSRAKKFTAVEAEAITPEPAPVVDDDDGPPWPE